MARRPPAALRVGFKRFAVVTDDQRAYEHGAHAVCFPEAQEIVLRSNRGPDTLANDVLHETLHACFDVALLDSDTLKAAADAEEEAVSRLAPVLLQLLRDNPRLVSYLADRGAE